MSASSGMADRFRVPFYSILEYLLPYGKRLRADLDEAHKCTREVVENTLRQIKDEELGKSTGDEGRGMLLKALLETDAGMDKKVLADSCLNFLTAGEHHRVTLQPLLI
jgi:hypothetical protein